MLPRETGEHDGASTFAVGDAGSIGLPAFPGAGVAHSHARSRDAVGLGRVVRPLPATTWHLSGSGLRSGRNSALKRGGPTVDVLRQLAGHLAVISWRSHRVLHGKCAKRVQLGSAGRMPRLPRHPDYQSRPPDSQRAGSDECAALADSSPVCGG